MEKRTIIERANEIIEKHEVENIKADSIMTINWRPHPPTVGNKTMKWAHSGGGVGIIDGDAPCDYPGCNLTFKEHHGDRVLFLKLSDKVDSTKAEQAIKDMKSLLEEACLDGVAFVQVNKDCAFE